MTDNIDKASAPDANTLDDNVLRWVETSGRALELRTARAFAQGGATVAQSFPYTDSLQDVEREGDVLANFTWRLRGSAQLACTLRVVVECKSGTSRPWVAFTPTSDERQTRHLTDWLVRAWAPSNPERDTVARAWEGCAPFDDLTTASHVVAATLGSKSPDPKQREANAANDTIRQALSAANAIAKKDLSEANTASLRSGGRPTATFVLAAVVTAAPLFMCGLDSDGEVDLTPTDHLTVQSTYNKRPQRVHVLNESYLEDFIRHMRYLSARASD